MGKITDAQTKEPLPFVNIIFKGKAIGTTTDFEGKYALETKNASDSLLVSFIGYIPVKKKIIRNKFQFVNIELEPENINLSEVVIRPGENPAEVLLKKIIENKINNNKDKLEAYQYEAYNKIQFDANNIREKFKNRRILRPFKFVFNYMDTSTVNGKAYLPMLLSESLSDVYFRKTPKTKKEYIKASKISGTENESISQFLGSMYQDINLYDNYITLFDKNFVSPIANFGLGYYKYYLIDSAFIGDKWCYEVMFKPRRKQELTFTGNFWVHDTSFAIKKAEMRVVDDANLNFINDLILAFEFDKIDNQYWMVTKDYFVVDFNIIDADKKDKSPIGFYGRKTTTYKNFTFNKPKENSFYSTPIDIHVNEDAFKKDEQYWVQSRHDSLLPREKGIYEMVDSLKSLPIFNTYINIAKTIVTGYYITGNFEIGPYMSMLSFNSIEGTRLRFGGRTSNDFSTKIMLEAYAAYGTTDETFKHSGGFTYMLSKNPRRSFGASYKYDVEQLGESPDAFSTDFLLASVFRRSPANKLSMIEEYKGFYEHEWFTGFSNTFKLNHRVLYPIIGTTFEIKENNAYHAVPSIVTSEATIGTRFAYQEKYVMGEFERSSLGTKYPILTFQYGFHPKNIFGSDYDYHRVVFGIEDWFNVGTFGWTKYSIETGKIWGTLPFPLLKLHEGNETWFFDEYSFNMMNYYEFASDQYLSYYLIHHFDGLFLNKIPLMRKLKWKEVAYFKGVIGSLTEANKQFSRFPSTLGELKKPYMEAGLGIENILKFIRVDAMWRLSYLDHPNIKKFELMVSFQFLF